MAKYSSVVNISGAVGDLVFYNLNGVQVVRKKSGFNSDDFKKKKSYEKVRENSSEFGHCSKSGKMLRETLDNFIGRCGDKYMYQKFAKTMTQIKDLDSTSVRGKRRVENGLQLQEGMGILKSFKFGMLKNFSAVQHSVNLLDHSLQFRSGLPQGKLYFITLIPDFNGYICNAEVQMAELNMQNTYIFDAEIRQDSPSLLYFGAVENEGEITMAGFI